MKNTLDKQFFEFNWIAPQLATPDNGQIVVICCDVVGADEHYHEVLQTAVYELREDGTEAWHCGQPFVTLKYWYRLPPVPKTKFKLAKKPEFRL